MDRPTLFIASSTEGLQVARSIKNRLRNDAEVTVWDEGFFDIGSVILTKLQRELPSFDFAIIVLTPDDEIRSRDSTTVAPRDNVILELGLFIQELGLERCYVVHDVRARPKIPSDLAGVMLASYNGARSDRNLIGAVEEACTPIRMQIIRLGSRMAAGEESNVKTSPAGLHETQEPPQGKTTEGPKKRAASTAMSLALAEMYRSRGQLVQAATFYEAAVDYYSQVADQESLARAKVGLAAVCAENGEYATALKMALEAETATTDRCLIAEAKLRRGICCRRLRRYPEALESLEQSLGIWMLEDRISAGETLIALGDVYRKLENWTEAKARYQLCVDLVQTELQERPQSERAEIHLAQAHMALGRVHMDQGQYHEAERLLLSAFQSLEKAGSFFYVEICAQLIGRLHKFKGQLQEARHWFHESFVATSITGNNVRLLETLLFMAQLARQEGDLNRAQALATIPLVDAKRLMLVNQVAHRLARLFAFLGDVACEAREFRGAEEAYRYAVLSAVRAGSEATDEVFAQFRGSLTTMTSSGLGKSARDIVSGLITWWSKVEKAKKGKPQLDQHERVSKHLFDLMAHVRSRS